jgi:uncharacterized protein (TIRG00374 family)
MFCWVVSWRTLLGALSIKIGFRKAFAFYWIGYFLDLILPCQSVCGDVTRIYLVQKETQGNYGVIAAAGITNRLVAYSIVAGGLTTGLVYVLASPNVPEFARFFLMISWVGAMAFLSVLFYLALSKNAADKLVHFALRILKALHIRRYSHPSPRLIQSLESFHDGFDFFRMHPRFLITPIIFQFFSFILNFGVYVLVFYSLGFGYQLLDLYIVVYFLAGAIQDATAAFSVGGLEILLTSIFIFYGIAPALSVVAATILRSVTFWFPLIVGYIVVQVMGAKRLTASPPLKNGASIQPLQS